MEGAARDRRSVYRKLTEEGSPEGIDSGVGDGRGGDSVILTPGAAVEDAGESGQQDVAPVEGDRALVEMGEAEDGGGDEKCRGAADAAFEEVLHPAAEEDFFRERDTDEGEDPGRDDEPGVIDVVVEVEEAERESDGDCDRQVEEEFAEADAPVAGSKAEVVADGGEAADGEEGVEACIEKRELAEEAEFGRPGGFEPAEIDAEAEGDQHEEIEEMAALLGIEVGGEGFECSDEDGYEEVDEEPGEGEDMRGEGDDEVREGEDGGEGEAEGGGQRLRGAGARFAGESEGEERDEEQGECDGRGDDGEREGHVVIVAGW
jgi:hypothetical protein